MATLYTANGMLIDTLKRRAKSMRNSLSISLAEAQSRIAIDKGFKNWPQMMHKQIETLQEDGDSFIRALEMKAGRHSVVHTLTFDGIETLTPEKLADPTLYFKLYAWHDRGGIRFQVEYSLDAEGADFHYAYPLVPVVEHSEDILPQLLAALKKSDGLDGSASGTALINVFNDMKLWNLPVQDLVFFGQAEALLEAELFTDGTAVGDRIVFHTDYRQAWSLDSQFVQVNVLEGDQVIVSNGAEDRHELVWKIMPRHEFDNLVLDMADEFGIENVDAMDFEDQKVTAAEAWLHEHVFSDGAQRSKTFLLEDARRMRLDATLVPEML